MSTVPCCDASGSGAEPPGRRRIMSGTPRRQVLAIVVAALAVAGCSSTSNNGTPSAAAGTNANASATPVTLRVAIDPSWQFMATAKAMFEKAHPGVKVVLQTVPGNTYYQNITQELSIPNPPDISVLEVGPGPYSTLVKDHLLVNVDSVWASQDLAKNYWPVVRNNFTSPDGHHYAVSTDLWWGPQIYYSFGVLRKAGVTPPSGHMISQDQFLAMMSKLKASGYVPLAVDGTDDALGFGYLLSSLIESSCGDTALANLENNWKTSVPETTKWTSPCVVKALSTLNDWQRAGVFGDSPTTRNYTTSQGLFEAGRAGTRMDASWFPNELAVHKVTAPYGWIMVPAVSGGIPPKFQFVTQDSLGITAKSQHVALAKQFLELLVSQQFESRQAYFNDIGGMPGREDIPFPPASHPVTVSMRQAMPSMGVVMSLPFEVPYGAQGGALTQEVNAMLSGQQSPEAAAQALANAVAQARRSG